MNGHGIYATSEHLEEEGGPSHEAQNGFHQTSDIAASVSEGESIDKRLIVGPSNQNREDSFEGAIESTTAEGQSLDERLDVYSTPRAHYQSRSASQSSSPRANYQSTSSSSPIANYQSTSSSSSVPVVSLSKGSNFSPSPQPQRSLQHCITAPVGGPRNLFHGGHDDAFSRSVTGKRESTTPDLKLDRLSDHEKEMKYISCGKFCTCCWVLIQGFWHHSSYYFRDLFMMRKLIENLVKIQKNGTVEVDITKSAPELLELHSVEGPPHAFEYITTDFNKTISKLKIAMLVVGTRGDVQPFLAMAKRLQEFGHHVRLATHSNFCKFVKSSGIDFYPLGGDPRILAGYMARNKGLIPSAPGEISTQRLQLKAIIESLLPACTEPDIETGEPFKAQAIIANPPAYGHAHVAEALGVPIHMFFTMPWTLLKIPRKLRT